MATASIPLAQEKGFNSNLLHERLQQFLIVAALFLGVVLHMQVTDLRSLSGGFVFVFVLAMATAFIASNSERYFTVLAVAPIAFCSIIVAWCVFSPLPGFDIEGLPGTDRSNYFYIYIVYNPLDFSNEYEMGFLAAIVVLRRLLEFQSFLVACVAVALLGYLRLLTAAGAGRYFPLLLCVSLGYFAFWSGTLNITRQFVAAGLLMIGAGFLIGGDARDRQAHLRCAALTILASLFHSSAIILFAFQGLILLRQRDRVIGGIWAFNLSLFAMNLLEINPLRLFTPFVERLQRYDLDQISSAGLTSVMASGVGTGNRLDWAVVLAAPMLVYAVLRYRQSLSGDRPEPYAKVALLYSATALPFFSLSFLIFADRLAYYAYVLMPVFLIILASAPSMRVFRGAIVGALAAIAISQFALGWYGYTPLYWADGLPAGR